MQRKLRCILLCKRSIFKSLSLFEYNYLWRQQILNFKLFFGIEFKIQSKNLGSGIQQARGEHSSWNLPTV